MCQALNVPITYFYDADHRSRPASDGALKGTKLFDLLQRRDAFELATAFNKIRDRSLCRAVVKVVEHLAAASRTSFVRSQVSSLSRSRMTGMRSCTHSSRGRHDDDRRRHSFAERTEDPDPAWSAVARFVCCQSARACAEARGGALEAFYRREFFMHARHKRARGLRLI